MKKILAILMVVLIALSLVSCNYNPNEMVYQFDYAIVMKPDGSEMRIDIKQWSDYEDGEQIQVVATDGTVYLLNSFYTILVREGK